MPASRRTLLKLLGTSGLLAAGGFGLAGCDAMPAEAIEAWQGPPPDLSDVRLRSLAWALLAPNPHNRQSWLVALADEDRIDLYCDGGRLLPMTDPDGRQVMVGHGCFLELLVMAAAHHGRRAEVAVMPDGEFSPMRRTDRRVAAVRLLEEPGIAADALFRHVPQRRSNKEPFDDRPLSAEARTALDRFDVPAGIGYGWTDDDARVAELRRLTEAAWLVEGSTPRAWKESIDLIRIGAADAAWYRDGMDPTGPMFRWGPAFGLIDRASMADPASMNHRMAIQASAHFFTTARGYAWLTTRGNSRAEQVAAGRTHVRLNLHATAAGIALHPLSQALQEFPEMAPHYDRAHELLGDGGTVQMLVRLGHAAVPVPSPRRPLADLLRVG